MLFLQLIKRLVSRSLIDRFFVHCTNFSVDAPFRIDVIAIKNPAKTVDVNIVLFLFILYLEISLNTTLSQWPDATRK